MAEESTVGQHENGQRENARPENVRPENAQPRSARGEVALTDGGLETELIYRDGFELPHFAAFPLLEEAAGRAALRRYYDSFRDIAERQGRRFVIGTPTWRANSDWGGRLGYSEIELARANESAARFVRMIADDAERIMVEGVLGPRGDGYVVTDRMTAEEAEHYHSAQIGALHAGGVDQIAALTLTYPEEAVGVVRAAVASGIRVVPSFTLETDGRLPDGTRLSDAIEQVDAATDGAAAFFMVNCAHPTHIVKALDGAAQLERIGGLRPNASRLSHAELDVAEQLDEGVPHELGHETAALGARLPYIEVLGGCCGTDARHVEAIAAAW